MEETLRALLLTDVVDSTQLVERLGAEGSSAAWTAHDRAARDLLPAHSGREIDKTDGFLLLFESVADAAAYALDYHRALKGVSQGLGVELVARAGIHFGPVVLRRNEAEDVARGAKPLEVEGLGKPVAARVMSLALGGQTLLTDEARTALTEAGRPQGSELESRGHWRLKGLDDPVEIHELGVRGEAPFAPPPDADKAYRVAWRNGLWLPLRDVPRSIPAERDAFLGREAELQDLARRLEGGARLVVLLGPGGTGKTRLATRHAWKRLGDRPGGAWFCDLSDARSEDDVFRTVAAVLGLRLGGDPVREIGEAIAAAGRCLVVLDNFEQVVEHASATVGRWLDRAPDAAFLVTSRERLHVSGEDCLTLEPLPVDGAAFELFLARARAASPGFRADGEDREHVAEVVRLLDGLPLAIELAAARVRVLGPRALRERMRDRFAVLAGARGRRERQATLRAAIDWSWDLLAPWEQAALAQASVFEGGFTLPAAEDVLELSTWDQAPWPLDVVQALVDKSLLRSWAPDRSAMRHEIDERWFGMYQSIREYAAEKLRSEGAIGGAAGGEADERATFERHGSYFAAMGSEEALGRLEREGGNAVRIALATELGNLVAACRRSVRRGDGATAAATFLAAESVFRLTGPSGTAVELARTVLSACELDGRDEERVRLALAVSLAHAGQLDEVGEQLEKVLAIHRVAGDRGREAIVLGAYVANLQFEQGHAEEARATYERALELHRELGQRAPQGTVLRNLGVVHAQAGRLDEALLCHEEALAVYREVGDRRGVGFALSKIGNVQYRRGLWDEARGHLEAALELAREFGDRIQEGLHLGNLGLIDIEQDRADTARERLQAALDLHRELGYRFPQSDWLSGLSRLAVAEGLAPEAVALARESVEAARGYPDLEARYGEELKRLLEPSGDGGPGAS